MLAPPQQLVAPHQARLDHSVACFSSSPTRTSLGSRASSATARRHLKALLLVLSVMSSGCVAARPNPGAEIRIFPHNVVTLGDFSAYVTAGKVPILDARRLEDYTAGHVPGALHLEPGADFYPNFKKLEPKLGSHRDQLVFVYCGDQWCGVGDNLWLQLVAQGYQHIVRFPGGWAEWKAANLPEETGP